MVRVKICGVTNWADCRLSVDLGADALGFNFYPPSPRSVTPAQAWEMIRRLPPMVTAVGVFVNWPAQVVAALARALHLGAVQLHGDESPREVRELIGAFRVIKAFPAPPAFRLAARAPYAGASAILVDGFKDGLRGGTGRTADWDLARRARKYGRVILVAAASGRKTSRKPSRRRGLTQWTWPAESSRALGKKTRAHCAISCAKWKRRIATP